MAYFGPMPQLIMQRAKSFANQTGTYVAFDQDGKCHVFPEKPLLLKNSGCWIPRGRRGFFQCEEIKFTDKPYKFTDWDEKLFCPSFPIHRPKFTHKTYLPSRKLSRSTL